MKKLAHIEWDNAIYSVGYNYIDNQHKKLIDIVNQFYDAVKAGKGDAVIYPILNGLVSYAEEHFMDEELAMAKAGCPKTLIEDHRAIHAQLVKEIFKVTEKVMASTETSDKQLMEVGELLRKWLMNHILDDDMQYAPYVRKLKGRLKE